MNRLKNKMGIGINNKIHFSVGYGSPELKIKKKSN